MEIIISSEQLAEWGASARAWLAIADKTIEKQQKQLMLILSNINIPINGKMNVYESILQAWKSAMSMADNLIVGIAQRVNDGAILLGLSAWHLYPSLTVLGKTSTQVRLNDQLLNDGGILTIGLQNSSPNSQDGLAWSLPLSFLRYYGSSVLSTKTLGSHSSRISMGQLGQVEFGCIMRDCRLVSLESLNEARFVKAICDCIAKAGQLSQPLYLLDI